MLKLMKYEFRKLRTTLVGLLLAMVVLELTFVLGNSLGKDGMVITSVVLLSLLAFGAYVYILISGVVSYSRELKDRTGYLVFMTPTRPISVVLSKLLCTLLAGVALTAILSLAAVLDYAYLARRLGLTENLVDQFNRFVRFTIGDMSFNLQGTLRVVAFTGLSVLIEVMLAMCTAYLAITVSATVLQNRKGFLRGLVSLVLFFLLSWGSTWLSGKAVELVPGAFGTGIDNPASMDMQTFSYMLGVSLCLHLALGAVFAVLSASLLKRKVSL